MISIVSYFLFLHKGKYIFCLTTVYFYSKICDQGLKVTVTKLKKM